MNEEGESIPQEVSDTTNRAFEALNGGDLETAGKLAAQLEKWQYSAHFEIRALICLEQGDREKAIEILRDGVGKVASVWQLWQLLGNCLSDNGDYEEALSCYERGLALDIDAHTRGSLQFNRAMVLSRIGEPNDAWQAAKGISNEVLQEHPALRWYVESLRLRLLADLGDCEQLKNRADNVENDLILLDTGQENFVARSVCWAGGGIALLECGDTERAREWANKALFEDRTNKDALQLLRDTLPDLPVASRYFQVLLEGDFVDEGGEELGFITSFSVVARIAEEAEQLALKMESPRWAVPPRVLECEFEGECDLQSIGVFDVGPYNCYPLNVEDKTES